MKPLSFLPSDDQALCGKCLQSFPAEVWHNKPGHGYERDCPQCQGNLFLIDSEILEAIILLNQKGYLTNYCCSGHEQSPFKDEQNLTRFFTIAPYVFFKQNITPQMGLPVGWNLDPCTTHGNKTMRGVVKKNIPITPQMLKLNENLLHWVKKLPLKK